MYGTESIGGVGDGVFPPKIGGLSVRNAGGTNRVQGSCMALDMASVTATSINPGSNAGTSVWNTLKDVGAAASSANIGYPLCILEQAIANGANGKATLYGIVDATVAAAGAAVGALMMPDPAGFGLILAATATGRVCGIQLAARNATTGRALVFFNGLGLGGPVV